MAERKGKKSQKKAEQVQEMPVLAKNKQDVLELGELDQYYFGEGTHYDIYKKLGAHIGYKNGKEGIYFAVWAPNAASVSVIGEFNGWQENACPMRRREPGLSGLILLVSFHSLRINDSRLADLTNFKWGDSAWINARMKKEPEREPMSIYEVHPGSWMKHPQTADDKDGYYNYKELAHSLTDYVKKMGYTHVELMGIAEHPFDGSWGYQVTGYYAPTSRHGTPADFMYLVNYLHKNKIGVILDWVPAHFPKDAHGLAEFDGTCLYEYADPRKGEHPDWGTKVFDFGKSEVKNFLIANALFWIEQFHVDGLRVDAVASILYLDYGREAGQWVPNIYGGNKNLEAIEFFKHLNSVVLGRNHGTMMIAEESTAWPKVTGKPEEDGLGFSMKWNMGWMHDFLEYMKLDPYFRQYNHNKMTFSMTYAYSEKYILVLSHDEVVHLKCSMINKMPGEYDDKFANLKAGYSFMLGHPGKKLLFMGQDFGQFREWSEARELDWYLLGEEKHQQLQNYVQALLKLYKGNQSLYQLDQDPKGFEWINADDNTRSIFSFVRHNESGRNNLLFVINFTPVARPDYRVGVPRKKQYQLVLNSDDAAFGGSGKAQPEIYRAVKQECDGRPFSFAYDLPAYGVAVFKF